MNINATIEGMPRRWAAAIILFIGILVSAGALMISWQEGKPESKKSAEYYQELLNRNCIP